MHQRPTSPLAVHRAGLNAKANAPRVVLATLLLVAWKLPTLASGDAAGLFLRAVKLIPLWLVLGGLLMSRRTRWVWPNRVALTLLFLTAVMIEVALVRSIGGSILSVREVIQQTAQWATFAAVGAALFWADGDDDRQQAGRLLVMAIGGYVGANLLMDQVGLVNPEPQAGAADAQLALLLGVHRARVVFPLSDGLNNFGTIAGAAILGGMMLCFARNAHITWRIAGLATFIAGVLAIVGTDSRALALAALIVGMTIGFCPRRKMWLVAVAALVVTISTPLVATRLSSGLDLGDQFLRVSRSPGDFATLNNRSTIWGAGLDVVLSGDAGLFGYGAYGQTVSGASMSYEGLFGLGAEGRNTLHNMVLQYFLDTGYAGAILVATLVTLALSLQMRLISGTHSASRIPMALLIYLVIAGITESVGTIYLQESFVLATLVVMASVVTALNGHAPPRWRTSAADRPRDLEAR